MTIQLEYEERVHLARILMDLLDEWGIEPQQRIVLLGLPDDTRPRALGRYRSGEPLPENDELTVRAKHLLDIRSALHAAFPMSEAMAKYWVTTSSPQFDGMTPLDVMLKEGVGGMDRVRAHLHADDAWR